MYPIISVEHLDAGYPGVTVLSDVNFTVSRGEVFALLGGSGCGKSTIMKHLIGLNPVPAGKITVAGLEMNRANRDSILRKIGVMYQSGALFGSMSVLENVMLPLEEFTRLPPAARRTLALMQLELGGFFENCAGVIFGNFKQCGDPAERTELFRRFAARIQVPVFSGLHYGHCARSLSLVCGETAVVRNNSLYLADPFSA